jgi:hypothetical protein
VRNPGRFVYKNLTLKAQPRTLLLHARRQPDRVTWEDNMKTKFLTLTAAAALLAWGNLASAAELRLSHQWSNNDVRHKVAQIVADEVAAADVDL